MGVCERKRGSENSREQSRADDGGKKVKDLDAEGKDKAEKLDPVLVHPEEMLRDRSTKSTALTAVHGGDEEGAGVLGLDQLLGDQGQEQASRSCSCSRVAVVGTGVVRRRREGVRRVASKIPLSSRISTHVHPMLMPAGQPSSLTFKNLSSIQLVASSTRSSTFVLVEENWR